MATIKEIVYGIRLFAGGSPATKMRIALLEALDAEIPEFHFIRYEAGNPGQFIVKCARGKPLSLSLRQVEIFAAGLRAGYRMAKGKKIDTQAIAGHYLPSNPQATPDSGQPG